MPGTVDLQAMIDGTPDNTVLTLPAETFGQSPIDTLRLTNRHGLTIDGTGCIVRRDSAIPSGGPSQPFRQILQEGCTGVSWHNLTVKGPKPDSAGYQTAYESQHNMAVSACTDTLIAGCVFQRAWGDHLYLAAGCLRTTISSNSMHQCGRHGISINSATTTMINANTTDRSHRWSVSFEKNVPGDVISDAVVAYNTLLNSTLADKNYRLGQGAFISGHSAVSGRAIFMPNDERYT